MLRRIALLSLLLLAAPASAEAACGVQMARAEYETPEVQVYQRGNSLRACLRATGKDRVIGGSYDDGGTAEITSFVTVFGGRYAWTSYSGSYVESADVQEESMIDLRTGKHVEVRVQDEDVIDVEVVAGPGVLVSAHKGVTAHYPDGRTQTLSTDESAAKLAINGARVYWQASGTVQTASLELPPTDPARTGPLMRTIGKCKPRKGARLIESDDTMHLSRAGGSVYVCRAGKTRRLGDVTEATIETGRHVSYRRGTVAGLLDVAKNERRELEGAGAFDAPRLVAAGPTGLRLWPDVELVPGPASEPVIGPGRTLYWLDGAQAPQMRVLPS